MDEPIDLTEPPALVYITKLNGGGVVAEYGQLKAFAFDVPTALRRLAAAIEQRK